MYDSLKQICIAYDLCSRVEERIVRNQDPWFSIKKFFNQFTPTAPLVCMAQTRVNQRAKAGQQGQLAEASGIGERAIASRVGRR